jgi:hypothetical protein
MCRYHSILNITRSDLHILKPLNANSCVGYGQTHESIVPVL